MCSKDDIILKTVKTSFMVIRTREEVVLVSFLSSKEVKDPISQMINYLTSGDRAQDSHKRVATYHTSLSCSIRLIAMGHMGALPPYTIWEAPTH